MTAGSGEPGGAGGEGDGPRGPGLEQRLDAFATWSYVHTLHTRIEDLERWRAGRDALADWRRWALPVTLSGISLLLSILTVTLTRR